MSKKRKNKKRCFQKLSHPDIVIMVVAVLSVITVALILGTDLSVLFPYLMLLLHLVFGVKRNI